MMLYCKARVSWLADDEMTYYLVPVPYRPGTDSPYLARVDCSNPLCTRVEVLGKDIIELNHDKDDDKYYLRLAKGEAIRALHQWGINITGEEVSK